MLDRVGDMDGRPHFVLRTVALLIAAMLGMQCVWLLATESSGQALTGCQPTLPLLPPPPSIVTLPSGPHHRRRSWRSMG